MGFKLFVEVRDYAPASLTHREKLTALILADDANDDSRLTFSSVVDPVIMERAMIKTERDMRKVLARLVETGVLEKVVSGRKGTVAKYRFNHLAPAGALDHLHTAKAVLSGPPMEEAADAQEVLSGPPNGPTGGPFRNHRRSNLDLPTPQTPSISSSSSDATRAPHKDEEEEGEESSPKTTPTEAVEWVLSLPWRRQPGARQRDHLAALAAAAMAAGWTPEALRRELTTELDGVRSLYAVWQSRLQELPAPPIAPVIPLPRSAAPECPQHPGSARRGTECAACWSERFA